MFDALRWHTNVRRIAENIVVFRLSSIQSSLFARVGDDESIRRRVAIRLSAESVGSRRQKKKSRLDYHTPSSVSPRAASITPPDGFNHTSLCLPIGLNGESYPA